jgi:hypothetical protein
VARKRYEGASSIAVSGVDAAEVDEVFGLNAELLAQLAPRGLARPLALLDAAAGRLHAVAPHPVAELSGEVGRAVVVHGDHAGAGLDDDLRVSARLVVGADDFIFVHLDEFVAVPLRSLAYRPRAVFLLHAAYSSPPHFNKFGRSHTPSRPVNEKAWLMKLHESTRNSVK